MTDLSPLEGGVAAVLMAQLEAAEVGSDEMDVGVWRALGFTVTNRRREGCWVCPNGGDFINQAFRMGSVTTSLDAGLALAERVLPGWYFGVQANRRYDIPDDWSAYLAPPEVKDCKEVEADAPTAPLALCIAILRTAAQASATYPSGLES